MLETVTEFHNSGRRLRVARVGSGPPLILLHGYPDNLQIWCELALRLSKHFSIIAFDWPGMGWSDAWPGGTTPEHMAERLLALMEAWKIERATIAGLDMGGQPALVFAAQHPERIDRLIVMNSLVQWDAITSWEIQLLRKFGWNRTIIRNFPRLVFCRAEKTFLPAGVRLTAELRNDLWDSFKKPNVREFIVRMCAGYQGTLHRLPNFYTKITCPTLVLWGEMEKHFPIPHAEFLHREIPSSTLTIIAGARHWMPWYAPAEVAESVLNFTSTFSPRST